MVVDPLDRLAEQRRDREAALDRGQRSIVRQRNRVGDDDAVDRSSLRSRSIAWTAEHPVRGGDVDLPGTAAS